MQDVLAWLIALWALSAGRVPHRNPRSVGWGRLADRGWAVSRVLALLALAWVTWIGGTLGIVPNSALGIAAVLVNHGHLGGVAGLPAARRNWQTFSAGAGPW